MRHSEHSWRDQRSTTLKDVARSVGVSESTASVVLNGARSGTRVSRQTRQTVIEAAERLGYRPNALARSLQTGRTNRIGIYSGRARLDSRSLFFAEILAGIFEGSEESGCNTVVHTSGSGIEMLLELVASRALDGLVVHAPQNDPIIPLLGELRVPAVAVADIVEGLPTICVDDVAGGSLLAQHLAKLGHKRILLKRSGTPPYSALVRMESFRATAEALGVEIVMASDEGQWDQLSCHDVQLLTQEPNQVTAIFGWNDFIAEQACLTLTRLGVSVPDEVAVVGFDGYQRYYAPKFELTTIRAPWVEVARTAVRYLARLIRGESVPGVTTLPIEFVRGTTT